MLYSYTYELSLILHVFFNISVCNSDYDDDYRDPQYRDSQNQRRHSKRRKQGMLDEQNPYIRTSECGEIKGTKAQMLKHKIAHDQGKLLYCKVCNKHTLQYSSFPWSCTILCFSIWASVPLISPHSLHFNF